MRLPSLRPLGSLVQCHSARLWFGSTIALLLLCLALKSAKLDSELSSWIQRTARIEAELEYVNEALGESTGSTSQLLIQSPNRADVDVLSVDSFMVHLEALAIATHVTVDLFDVAWNLKDLCFTPTLPDYEAAHVSIILDKMMPCAIKTPLDCFWEGSRLLGPEQPVTLGSIGPNFKWTSLNPLEMVETYRRLHPHSSFSYDTLLDWMSRVGISSGYQYKPCLDPTDPNCPHTAANKPTGKPPNVGAHLTGGCHGFAANQMHWREDEILSGMVKNKSGHIVRASALQSTIQLMGEQDMYDYWRKNTKVQDINNWSVEKAKLVLDSWQRRFKDELAEFSRKWSISSGNFKIHATTSRSMMEPIDSDSLIDPSNLIMCFTLMTLYTCFVFPSFTAQTQPPNCAKHDHDEASTTTAKSLYKFALYLSDLRRLSLALVTSFYVALTLIASYGLSSFMNLPFNLATTQILPPLGLYYGFNQFIMSANVYSRKMSTNSDHQTIVSDCLKEIFPVVAIEWVVYSAALLAATIIPVPAARVFLFQAITHISLASLASLVLVPTILTTVLAKQLNFVKNQKIFSIDITQTRSNSAASPSKFSITSKNRSKTSRREDLDIEDQIFSRIKDDLKNIQAEPTTKLPTDINISAQLNTSGLRTSLKLSASQTNRNSSSSRRIPIAPRQELDVAQKLNQNILPDLISNSLPPTTCSPAPSFPTKLIDSDEQLKDESPESIDEKPEETRISETTLMQRYSKLLTRKPVHILVWMFKLCIILASLSQIPKIKHGLQLRDIIPQDSPEYEAFSVQEQYFPVYNVFAVTKGNFDYPSNQKLLYDYFNAINRVEGVIKEVDSASQKFWLANFRDWLLELQDRFDEARNKSAIFNDAGWTPEATDTAKLAYKLLAQTGRIDNPIDKNQVETNRLVDSQGIINPMAFYYYLTAWVNNDPFTYATSEANFRPEPRVWNGNPDVLKIEKARPLMYAQIPILMKLQANQNSIKTISEMRSISQAFEQLNLPNFPTGTPFIFWDQFLNLDLVMLGSVSACIISVFVVISLMSNFNVAAIIVLPISLTIVELYGFMGSLSVPFNNILAVVLMSVIGITTVQTVHYVTVSITDKIKLNGAKYHSN